MARAVARGFHTATRYFLGADAGVSGGGGDVEEENVQNSYEFSL